MSTQNTGLVELASAFDSAPKPQPKTLKPVFTGEAAFTAEQEELRKQKEELNAAASDDSRWQRLDPEDMENPRARGLQSQQDQPQRPAPVGTLEVPVIDNIRIYPPYTGKVQVKFNVGDFGGVPKGVREFKYDMTAEQRMRANLSTAVTVDRTLADTNRVPGRQHDTALGVLDGKKIKLVRPSFMLELAKAGLVLRDVNYKRSSSGAYVVEFLYTRTPFEDGRHFQHCEQTRAQALERMFSLDTCREITTFLNPNMGVTVNCGPYVDARAERKLVVRNTPEGPVLKHEKC